MPRATERRSVQLMDARTLSQYILGLQESVAFWLHQPPHKCPTWVLEALTEAEREEEMRGEQLELPLRGLQP